MKKGLIDHEKGGLERCDLLLQGALGEERLIDREKGGFEDRDSS